MELRWVKLGSNRTGRLPANDLGAGVDIEVGLFFKRPSAALAPDHTVAIPVRLQLGLAHSTVVLMIPSLT